MRCSACPWSGVTTRGRVRLAVFMLGWAAVALLAGLELAGLLGLGEQVWPILILSMLSSIGLRLLIRGDRCPDCGEAAVVAKKSR
ncbi:MAG: hypothetical protein KC431_16180 [Myxococcales bacterium]|nr:hypothetical protein [Myxococcales bacterium]